MLPTGTSLNWIGQVVGATVAVAVAVAGFGVSVGTTVGVAQGARLNCWVKLNAVAPVSSRPPIANGAPVRL